MLLQIGVITPSKCKEENLVIHLWKILEEGLMPYLKSIYGVSEKIQQKTLLFVEICCREISIELSILLACTHRKSNSTALCGIH